MKNNNVTVHGIILGIFCVAAVLVFANNPAWAQERRPTYDVHLTDKIKKIPPRPDLYDKTFNPLPLKQCAKCHVAVFNRLKTMGTRHQKECTFCHEVFHTYAPGKVEYEDAIPKCQNCHGYPHGEREEVMTCKRCHSNAHSPLKLPELTADKCQLCHPEKPEALKNFPSKHTELECTDCHTSHGLIPSCFNCHSDEGGEPYHLTDVEPSVCLSCHPVHTPLEITYEDDVPQRYCASCHKNPTHERNLKIQQAAKGKDGEPSAHLTELTCATCHTREDAENPTGTHATIPDCFKCHEDDGHREGLQMKDCLGCHKNPHEPLNVSFNKEVPKKICGGCHVEVYDMLIASNTRHTKQTCAFCHPVHGVLPKCQDCHGVPHGQKMIQQFEGKCGACHGIAHNVEGRMKKSPAIFPTLP